VEFANYYSPFKWLTFDADASWSRARYSEHDPVVGDYIPEAVGTVLSAGASIDNYHHTFGSLRWRYFGPRTLIEDNSAQSKATSLFNLEGGYQIAKTLRVTLSIFNLLNATDDDITYYYESRLPGEPADGVSDFVSHPTIPRSARLSISVGF
jgi:outer membrane receptor protein involved in Fe transport